MIKHRHLLASAALILSCSWSTPSPAQAQTAATTPAPATTLNVACGGAGMAGCAIALPAIGKQVVNAGLMLVPVSSGGAVQSAQAGVCPGLVPAAIGTADGFDAVLHTPQCQGHFKTIAPALFPFYGYLIVAHGNAAYSLDELVNQAGNNTVTIADGKAGSDGQLTFSNILAANPDYRRVISEDDSAPRDALAHILAGSTAGYFLMDSPDSATLAAILSQTDAAGKPAFKLLDIRPGVDFFQLQGAEGQRLYFEAVIKPGTMGYGMLKTVSTNAELIVNTGWATDTANAPALAALTKAATAAQPAILSATHTPSDWTGH